MTDTITLPREELQAALDALEFDGFTPEDSTHRKMVTSAIQALRARLAQQEESQRPVAFMAPNGMVNHEPIGHFNRPLYTAPPRQEEKQDAPKESFVSMKEKPQAWMLITEAGACGGTFRYRVDVEVAARNLGGWFAIVPLYMSPQKREWKGLTDEEIHRAYQAWFNSESKHERDFVRAIEAKLKEKNDG